MKARQTGAATLFITIIILALLTMIAAVSAKIGMFELKTSANSNRAKEALHSAQGGLDYGAMRYQNDASWVGESLEMPFGGPGASVSVSAVTGTDSVVLNATGNSVDTTAMVRVEEKFSRVPIFDVGELPPLMANGNFPDSGSFGVVTNPNGGGTGVPVSGWTQDATKSGNSSWDTCNRDEWLYEGLNSSKPKVTQSDGFITCAACECSQADNKICSAGTVSETTDCPDILTADPIIDTFQQLFGIDPYDPPNSNFSDAGNSIDDWYEFMTAFATVELSNCSGLGPSSGDQFYTNGKPHTLPLIWVRGDCDFPNKDIGSYDAPIILFVEGSGSPTKGITFSGNKSFYGILFGFVDKYPDTPLPNKTEMKISAAGGATIYGVFMMNTDLSKAAGTFNLVYSESLLKKLVNDGDTFYELARYPGSWTDTK